MHMFNWIKQFFSPHLDRAALRKKYGIPETINIHWDTRDGFFIITSPEMPGLITEAKSHQELIEMVNDAVLTYYDIPEKESQLVHSTLNLRGYGTIKFDGKAVA